MTSKPVALLMSDLGVTKTHSRPHVSNDNPFSESGFKTMKYRPDYPARFGCLADARSWAGEFFRWYNYEHHHTGIGLLTPADVHFETNPGNVEINVSKFCRALIKRILRGLYKVYPSPPNYHRQSGSYPPVPAVSAEVLTPS